MNLRRFADTGEWTTRRYLSLLGTALVWLIVAIDAWYLWPTQLGGHTSMVIVSGESMEPTYFSGDLVIARRMDPSIGDVIIYAPEGLGGSQIVHRIIGGNAEDGWQMQGDNNNFIDPFTPTGSEVKGVVLVHYSNFGRVTALLLNPMIWAFVLLAALVLLLWWSDDCDDENDEDGDDAIDEGENSDTEPARSDSETGPQPRSVPDRAGVSRTQEASTAPLASEATLMNSGHGSPSVRTRVVKSIATPVIALLAVVGIGAGTASASQLAVHTAGSVASVPEAVCASQEVNVTPQTQVSGNNWQGFVVTGIGGDCMGLPITVDLFRSSGPEVTATGTVTGSSTQVATPGTYHANNIQRIVVKIGGWVLRSTWTPPGPQPAAICTALASPQGPPTGESCTVTYSTGVVAYNPWPNVSAYDFRFAVSTASPWWSLTIDVANPELPQIGVTSVHTNGNPQTGSCSGSVFTGYKNTTWGSNNGYMVMRNDGGSYGMRLCP